MQTQTITIDTYKVNELSAEIKEKVLSKYRDINTDYDGWDDMVTEEKKGQIEALGYYNVTLLYSGFWSQGDGACFTASVDLDKWLKAHKLSNKYRALFTHSEEVTITIKHNYHYYFATSTNVEEEGGYYLNEKAGKQLDEVIKLIEEERETLGNELYRELESAYDELTSDSAVEETLQANDFQFTKDGATSVSL